MDCARLKTDVIAAARAAGAIAVAVTDASPDPKTRVALAEAFARGDFATWPYGLARAEMAADPGSVLAGARSVICVAVPFATDPPSEANDPLAGRISNYAWSSDYHGRMRAILAEAAAIIDASAGGKASRVVCDTAPLAERAFAARAGLGWIGKHTNLIAPQAGSFIFLGEIVTTVALPPDRPLRKSCGSCARCITACPTGALRGDYTIDAVRCISDLTQRVDAIPSDLRPLIGVWVWGCDLCQDVCPPTRRAGRRGDPAAFGTREPDRARPALVELLTIRGGEFRRRYWATALGWRGPAILRRNAAVALGNTGDRAAVPALARALRTDHSALVRGHAAWALGRIGSPQAAVALAEAAEHERDAEAQAEIAAARRRFETFTEAAALIPRRTDT